MVQACGPLRQLNHGLSTSDGTLIRQATLPPTVHGDVAATCGSRTNIPALIFNDQQIHAFLHSVAWARAAQRHTKVVWKDDDSRVLAALFGAGTADVETGDQKRINAETDKITGELFSSFFDHADQGPAAVAKFLEEEQKVRDYALNAMRDTFSDARKINADILAATGRSLAALATIKCASTITVKTAGVFVGGWIPFAVSTGYSVSLQIITNWNKAGDGKAIAIQVGKSLGRKQVKGAAKGLAKIYEAEAAEPEWRAGWLSKRVAEMERKLASGGTPAQLRKLARDARRLQSAENAAASARRAASLFGSVRWIFLAADIRAAGKVWVQDMRAAGYAL